MKKLYALVFLARIVFFPIPLRAPGFAAKHFLFLLLLILLVPQISKGQVTLTTSPYTQNFNSIGTALPTGWTVRTGGTSTTLGNSQTFVTTATPWSTSTGQFANYASTNSPSTSSDVSATQASSTDRALGVRQSNSNVFDPGAAFIVQIANTTGLGNFSLSFKIMNLDASVARSTSWNVDYGFGSTPTSFTNATTSPASVTTGGSSAWGSTTVTVNFGTALDNNSGPVWIRIVTKNSTSGSGNPRPATAIDDYSLSWYTIATTTASYGPYCITTTSGSSSFNVPFTTTGTMNSGNVYTVQLSDASGSFSSPTSMGTLTSTANSGNISATIPAGLSGGSGYRIRVISSSPSLTSSDNGSNITINAIFGQPSNATVCSGSSATFTVTTSGSPIYQWQESPDLSTWTSLSNGTFSGITYSGATSASLIVTGPVSNYYRCLVTFSGCTLTSSAAQLNYYSLPANPPSPTTNANPNCGSEILSETAAPSGITYYWQGTTSNGTSTSNNASSTSTVSSSGTYYVRAQNNTSSCWSSGSGSITVTIIPSPTITTQPTDQTIQIYSTATFSVVTSASSPSYQWQYSADGSTNWASLTSGTPTGITYTGRTSATLKATNSLNTSATYYYRCVVTAGGCSSTTNTVKLTSSTLSATNTIPFSIGKPCSTSGDSVMFFTYDRSAGTLSRQSSCKPYLASPGLSAFATSVSFNPADGYLYMIRFTSSSGVYTSYVWRWLPGTCPGTSSSPLAVYKTYSNQLIAGLDFDQTGKGYQIVFTGTSAPYGLALQQVDFSTNTFGPIKSIDTQGKKIYSQNGDLVMIDGYSFMVWDNKYFSLNYNDYNTSTPLKATFIDTLAVTSGSYIVGLAYAQGKMVASASSCSYYDFNIITGRMASLTANSGTQYSTDMSNITSGVGAAKKLVSSTPVSSGVYDLVYDITIKNYGDYPVSNVQVSEDLTTIHPSGASVISNVSASWQSNPASLSLDSSYNGVTNKNLLVSSQTLPNYPDSLSSFVIRVKLRLSSVASGTEYDNNAIVTGTGYNSISLFDSSTNGKNPDRNGNFRPDDKGESQPTPFTVKVTADFPPCTSLSNTLYSQDFGKGTVITTTLPTGVTTDYTAGSNPMDEETYVITNNANNGNTSQFVNITDHAGIKNGNVLLVNADVNNYILFQKSVNISCVNLRYTFSAYIANAINSSYTTFCNSAFGATQYPNLTFVVRDASDNSIISAYSTSDITDSTWNLYGLKWVMPSGVTRVKLQIYNTGQGGCGNVVALDDISFGICDPQPTVSVNTSSVCTGTSAVFNASLADTSGLSSYLQYQWQSSSTSGSGYTDISGATSTTYTINPAISSSAKYYQIVVSATGNSGNTSCQSVSNNVYLTVKDSSSSPTSATADKSFICPGQTVNYTVNGGSLGTNASWKWYQLSCGGTYVASGTTITQNPLFNITYYVRAEGDCNTTRCASVMVPVTCLLAEEIINLKGNIANQLANLFWTITSDKNISIMEVERSVDGVNFKTIKQIIVNGLADRNGYSLKDDVSFLNVGKVYYRVKITHESGEIAYSKIINFPIVLNAFNAIVIPNPASAKAHVNFYLSSSSEVKIKLFNAQSQLLQTNSIAAPNGFNTYDIPNIDKLPSGIYFLKLNAADNTTTLKLIVE